MKWPTPFLVVAACAATAGCDSIPFLSKKAADSTATAADTAAPIAAADSTAAMPVDSTTPPPRTPVRTPPTRRQAPVQPVAQAPLADEPWTPEATGTVRPGMSRDEVVGTWGAPVAERTAGGWTYLYYRNGCEVTCGTFDVVFLENGQVVDAIVRGPGHDYAGVSSSPPDRAATPTPPGNSTT